MGYGLARGGKFRYVRRSGIKHQVVPGYFLEENLGMAWWTHLLFFRRQIESQSDAQPKEVGYFAVFRRALRQYIYDNLIDILYILLSIFTYLYLTLSIITFFLQEYVPKSFPHIIDILSEPYLGVLGIYVVVKEIERRRGKVVQKRWGEAFTAIWFIFFVTATLFTYFSESYHLEGVYKTVVTNALAAIIIRIGTILR